VRRRWIFPKTGRHDRRAVPEDVVALVVRLLGRPARFRGGFVVSSGGPIVLLVAVDRPRRARSLLRPPPVGRAEEHTDRGG
jgi:hypothetical protein